MWIGSKKHIGNITVRPVNFNLSGFYLMRSSLKDFGPVYDIIETYPITEDQII